MTDIETLQAFVGQQPPQADQAQSPPAEEPPPSGELPKVPVPAPTTTPADIAVLKDYMGIQPMYQTDKTVTQQLPPFEEPTYGGKGAGAGSSWGEPGLDITTGVKPGPVADPFDVGTLDDFMTDRAAAMGQDQMQRAVELMEAAHQGKWTPPPGWLHDIALRVNAQTPSFPELAKSYGKAALNLAGLPTEMPQTAGQWANTLLHTPLNSVSALVNDQMAVLGMLGSAAKTAGQAAMEEVPGPGMTREQYLAPRKAAAVGFTKGVTSLYPLYEEAVTKLGIPLYNQLAPALGMSPADRVDYIERTANAYNRASNLVHGEEKLLGYDPTAAPATEAVGEFAGGQAPFMLLPEAAGVNNLAARTASRIIRPVVERAVPLATAADVAGQQLAIKAAPAARQALGTAAKVAGEAGAGYVAGELTGHQIGGRVGAALGAILGVKGGIRDIVAAFKAAPAATVDEMGPALIKSLKQGRPYYSALQDSIQDEVDRLGVQNRMIRDNADELAKTDAKMPNGDNVFTKDELKNNAITVRDNLAIQSDKLTRLQQWAKFERLVTDTVTGAASTLAATVPTGLVLGGVNALQAPPGQEQAAALQGMQAGMAMDLPFAPGKVSSAMRENNVRALQARARANAITPDHPDYAANMAARTELAKTPEGRVKLDAMDQLGGLAAPLGTKIIAQSPDGLLQKYAKSPESMVVAKPPTGGQPQVPGKPVAPNALYDPIRNEIHYNYQAPIDTLGHEVTHPFEVALGENTVGQRIRSGLSNPADQPYVKAFLDRYADLVRRSNPNFDGLTPNQQVSEIFAELGRDVMRETPPSALYGGRSGWQLIQRTAGRIADMIRGRREVTREIPGSPGQIPLRAPQFPGTRDAMQDLLFGLGERAKYRQTYGRGAEPPQGAAPAAGTPRTPTALSPEEQDVLSRVHAASQKLGGLGVSPSDVGEAIVAAKQAGVDVNDSNILKIVLNQAGGRDPLHGITVAQPPPQPGAQPPQPGAQPGVTPQKPPPNYAGFADLTDAAKAHAAHVGQAGIDSGLVTYREKFGKGSIWGTRLDPTDPFHQHLMMLAEKAGNLSPEARSNLEEIQKSIGQTVTLDHKAAPREGAKTRGERIAERAEAPVEERKAGEVAREKRPQSFVPTGISWAPGSEKFMVNGFNPDTFLSNAKEVIDWAKGKNKITFDGVNDPRLVQYFQQWAQLHQAGYSGDGSPITGTKDIPVKQTISQADADKLAIPNDDENGHFLDQINLMMGERRISKGAAEKRALADANSLLYDPKTGETNPLRTEMMDDKRWGNLHSVYESHDPQLISKIRSEPVKDKQVKRPSGFTGDRAQLAVKGRPSTDFVAANLMPSTAPVTPGRIGAPGIWDVAQTGGHVDELAKELGVDPKKRFYEQKPAAQQKITDHFSGIGEAQFMPATGFYTKSGKAIDEKMGGAADSEQVKALLRNAGIGKNEMEWLGLNDLPKGRLTKEEVQNWIGGHVPQLTTMTLGQAGERPTQYNSYKLPGGENYREILFNLPTAQNYEQGLYISPHFGKGGATNLLGHLRTTDRAMPGGGKMLFLEELQSDWAQAGRERGYDTPETTAQRQKAQAEIKDLLRQKDEIIENSSRDLDVRKVGMGYAIWDNTKDKAISNQDVSIVYPSWGETARRMGSAGEPNTWAFFGSRGMAENYLDTLKRNGVYSNITPEDSSRMADLVLRAKDLEDKFSGREPIADMPFKGEAWKKLLMRQAIKTAVSEGKDSLGWTTGEQQAERYNLSKMIHSLYWAHDPDTGNYTLEFQRAPHTSYERLQHGSQTSFKSGELPNVVGMDLTKKILNSDKDTGSFEGLDLKIGGEGMKGFYDRELVNIANDIGKKFGAKVRDTQISTEPEGWKVERKRVPFMRQAMLPGMGGEFEAPPHGAHGWGGGEVGPDWEIFVEANTREEAERTARYYRHDPAAEYRIVKSDPTKADTTVHELPITPQFRESVQNTGQPLWMPSTAPVDTEGGAGRLRPDEKPEGTLPVRSFALDSDSDRKGFRARVQAAQAAHKYGAAVEVKDPAFYEDPSTKLFLTRDGLAGAAVTKDGDLVSGFSHPDSKEDFMPLLREAASHAKTLDAFDLNGKLPELYAKVGFKPVARVAFDPEFAPPNWNHALMDEPDVLLMAKSDDPRLPDIQANGYAAVKDQIPRMDYMKAQEAQRRVAGGGLQLMPATSLIDSPIPREPAEGEKPLRGLKVHQGVTVKPTGKGGVVYPDVQRALDEWTKAKGPAETVRDMVNRSANEIRYQMQSEDSGREWYRKDVQNTVDHLVANTFPQLEDDTQRKLFLTMTGVTSYGAPPDSNLTNSLQAYGGYAESGGKIPLEQLNGQEYVGYGSAPYSLRKLQTLINDKGEKGAMDWLLTKHPISEIRAASPDISVSIRGKKDDMAYGAMIFGPKGGPFVLNLNGIFDHTTVDIWGARTLRRWLGTMGQNIRRSQRVGAQGREVDKPVTAAEIRQFHEVMGKVAKRLGLSVDDAQALQWYFEHELYRVHGVGDAAQSYSGAVKKANENYGELLQSRQNAGAGGQAPQGGANAPAVGLPEGFQGSGEGIGEQPFAKGGVVQPVQSAGVYLIRHGCTRLNAQSSKQSPDLIRGHTDVPLDDQGRKQAAKLGKSLGDKGIKAVYTSDLSRARDTGAPVAASNKAPLIPTFGLRPWDLGPTIQGHPSDDVQPQIEHLIDHPDEPAEGGESFNDFSNRFRSTLHQIVNAHKGHKVAVVTHYRGAKLLESLAKDGQVDAKKMKTKDGALEPGGVQFLAHPSENHQQPTLKGIKSSAIRGRNH